MGQSSDTLAADVRRGGSSADGIPFLDLAPVNEVVREKVVAGLQHLFDTNAFVNGPEVVAFEEAYASFCGSPHCVGLASGLDALRIGLIAAGVSAGDEVIVPAQTFVATFEAVTQAGGRPVVVDVDERDYCISVDAVEAALTSRTAAVLPVHLYGQMADVSRLSTFVRQRGLVLLEDAAQAHGATRDGVKAGTAGHIGAFSFYPGKNLGALGDAGGLITPDAELASAARALREHGQHVKYQSSVEGYTARLDTIQAIALAAKLEHLDRWTARRRELASLYDKALAGLGDLRLPLSLLQASRSGTSTSCERPIRMGLRARSRNSGLAPAVITRSRRTAPMHTRTWDTVLARSRSPRRSVANACRFRSIRGSRTHSSSGSSRASVDFSVADAPTNSAPHRLLREVKFGADVVVQSFVNLYECSIGDEHESGRSSRSSPTSRSDGGARSRVIRSSAAASRSETRSSWGTGSCSSTTSTQEQRPRRARCNGKETGAPHDPRRRPRIARVRRDRARRCDDRTGSADRSRGRRHA